MATLSTAGQARATARRPWRVFGLWLGAAALLAVTLLLTGCGETAEVATNQTPIAPDVPEQDLAQVPEGLEAASLTIEGGKFVEARLILQENQPTVLRVANRDGQAYEIQIVPNLVDPTPIPAATTTQIELTDPDAGTFEARLLKPDAKQVLAGLPVEVETPAGNA